MKSLKKIRGFLLDMDGTFYLGDKLLPGALEFLRVLNSKGIPFLFLTNNSSKSAEDYQRKLTALGVEVEDARVMTSGDATIAYLLAEHADQKVFLMGTESLRQSFAEAGVRLEEEDPQVAVLGFDTGLAYKRLARFCDLVRAGLPYIATHPDFNCPVEGGMIPDVGSFMALIEASTGRKADVVIGKPNRMIARAAAARMGVAVEDLCMVGDRLYTDIALGEKAGIATCLVLSGETSLEDLPGSPFQPDWICQDLAGLTQVFRET